MAQMHVASNIRRYRLYRNYTMQYIADRIGLTRAAYSAIENGNSKKLSVHRVEQIATVLNVPMFCFFVASADLANKDLVIQNQSAEIIKLRKLVEDLSGSRIRSNDEPPILHIA